jgi:hypothetical protein
MLMVLGLGVFLVLTGSAVLGMLMLIAGTAMAASRKWRPVGVIALCAGCCGALLALLGLLVLTLLLDGQTGTEIWLLFAASGFGWAALISFGLYGLANLLQQPGRWIDRKRNANAYRHAV